MPVYLHNQPDENTYLVVWHITETSNDLMAMLNDLLHDHQSKTPKDNKHWLASRLCLLHLFPGQKIVLSKDDFNKPHLEVNGMPYYVSITHSHDMAAVLISPVSAVGMDIELTDHRIERVMYKFCNAAELAFLVPEQKRSQLTVIWSAKEALYKYYGKKELDFIRHLSISPFTEEGNAFTVNGRIEKDGKTVVKEVRVTRFLDYVLTLIYGAR